LPIQLELIENNSLNKKLSKADFRRRAQEILGFLQSEYDPFKDDTPDIQKKRKLRALEDPFYFFRTYLPHYFNLPFAPFHYELVSLLERRPTLGHSTVVEPVVVSAPREFAKTTITSFGYSLHQILFKLRHFIMIVSDTQDLASDLTGYIYLELAYNERIKHDFGKLVRDNWAVHDFITLNDVRVKARGRGQRIRGLKHKQHRPDLLIMDDLENDTSSRSPDRCKDLLRWIAGSAYGAIDVEGNLFIIGTLLSKTSALHTMVNSKDEPYCYWTRRNYRAITTEDESLWPAKFPMEILAAQRQQMGTTAFNREKMGFPDDDQGYFLTEWFQYYKPEDIAGLPLVVVGFYDPSLETGATNDFKAIISLGFDRQSGIYYVLDAFIKKVTLEMTVQTAISLHRMLKYLEFGIEDNLFQRLLLKEFEDGARVAGVTLPLRGVTSQLAKETRIASLSSLVERGQIRFRENHTDQGLLVEQLIYFPAKNFHDDGPDALEGAIRMAQKLTFEVADVEVVPKKEDYQDVEYGSYRPLRHIYRPFSSREVLH